ncbi:helix-turn-helix domain-containing protein, partial [Actinomadura adrarensis]
QLHPRRQGQGGGTVAQVVQPDRRHPGFTFDTHVGRQLGTTALDLLAVLAQERQRNPNPEVPETARVLLARVQDYILKNLGDPDLAPESIAAAHNISIRYLHRLFRFEGITVARWIKRRRLEACRRDLSRALAAPNVATIAGRWGFANHSHFSREFRNAYGVSPSEWQATARAT